MRKSLCKLVVSVFSLWSFFPLLAHADEVQVAVAANFAVPMQKIADDFEKATGHKAVLAIGATGKFYAQISHGAPFEILLAADADTPARLETEGFAVADSRFTYAIGRLVLWSADPSIVDPDGAVLSKGSFANLSIANPKLAPYGQAAIETLTKLQLMQKMMPHLVMAENIAQAYQFVSTGNATLGFVAMSQVYENDILKSGSAWIVPAALYNPIRQDAVLLKPGAGQAAAQALLAYLKTPGAQTVIRRYGYRF